MATVIITISDAILSDDVSVNVKSDPPLNPNEGQHTAAQQIALRMLAQGIDLSTVEQVPKKVEIVR